MTDKNESGPTISIVTACYNSLPFLDRIHRSLKAQTYKNFEWICVDDCSTDATVEALLSLDPPGDLGMKVFRLPMNSGGPLALAVGTQRAECSVTIWLDHDDELFDFALAEVARHWSTIHDDDEVAGLFFRATDPVSGRLVGRPLPPGVRMQMSESHNRYPDVSDGTAAVKTALMQKQATLAAMEPHALNGPLYVRLTADRKLVFPDSPPIRFYHRDNPNSQTISERLSRKTVTSYAHMLNLADRHYWRRPMMWLRQAGTLLRYSKAVHGSWLAGVNEIRRGSVRFLVTGTLPLAMLAALRRRDLRVVSYPSVDLNSLDRLPDLRKEH